MAAALACREARSDDAAFDVVGAFNAFAPASFPVRLSPFKLVVRLLWDVGESGRFVVGLRLVNSAGGDLIDPMSAAFSFEPPDVEDLAGRTIILNVPSLEVTAPELVLGLVSVNDQEVAQVPISVRQKTRTEAAAGG